MRCPNNDAEMEIQYVCDTCGMRAGFVGSKEEAVIEAAIKWLNSRRWPDDGSQQEELIDAVDDLIKVREELK